MPKFSSSRQEWHALVLNSKNNNNNLNSRKAQAIFEAKHLLGISSKNQEKQLTSSQHFDFKISAIGFILSFFIFSTLILQRNWPPKNATIFAFSLGSIITYLMIRFPFIQSSFLLTIPGLSSSKGRSAIAAIAIAATLNGPGQSLSANYDQISYSLACIQQISSKFAGKGWKKYI